MNVDEKLRAIRDAIQQDVGDRGLARDPHANLINACPDDFAAACRSLAVHPAPILGVVTGFFIPAAGYGETDGPLGAVYLARTLPALGVRVALVTDGFCRPALAAGLTACGAGGDVRLMTVPPPGHPWDAFLQVDWPTFARTTIGLTHLLALERVGPSHTTASVQTGAGADSLPGPSLRDFAHEVPREHRDRCHTMRGVDITGHTSPAHLLFEQAKQDAAHVVTLGVGDGGNEIGMGKVPWSVIRVNIPNGAVIACRIATDYLIVAGVSNWGAYALACGVAAVKGITPPADWFDPDRELSILGTMVKEGPLVDGVTGEFTPTVDGLSFEQYAAPLRRLGEIMRA